MTLLIHPPTGFHHHEQGDHFDPVGIEAVTTKGVGNGYIFHFADGVCMPRATRMFR